MAGPWLRERDRRAWRCWGRRGGGTAPSSGDRLPVRLPSRGGGGELHRVQPEVEGGVYRGRSGREVVPRLPADRIRPLHAGADPQGGHDDDRPPGGLDGHAVPTPRDVAAPGG